MGDSNERERGDKALQPYLEKDEKIQTWAYGTQRSPLLILAGMASWVAACLPAALWFIVAGVSVFSFLMGFFIFWIGVFFLGHECEKRLRKDFLVAVTARRLLIVRIKNPMFFTPDLFDQSLTGTIR